MTHQTRYRLWVTLILSYLVFTSAFVWTLAHLEIDHVSGKAGSTNGPTLWPYWLSFAGMWLLLSAVAWLLTKTPVDAIRLPRRRSVLIILTVAIGARITILLTSGPNLSDDIWRYIHDGATLGRGQNPYARAPAELNKGEAPRPHIIDRINHPQLVTIYQPISQYVFAVFARFPVASWDPRGDLFFRSGFVVFDMLIVAMLLWNLRREGRSPWWVVLYAWHPLPLSEVAGSGHQDVVGVVLLLAFLTTVDQKKRIRPLPAAFALAAATAVKPHVLPLWLPLAWRWRHQRLFLFLGIGCTTLVGMILFTPFALMDGGITRLFDTMRTYADEWAFNSSLHGLVWQMAGSRRLADVVMALVLIGFLFIATLKMTDLWQLTALYLLVWLLCASTVHPWYLLWPLTLIALRFDPAIWVFSLTISWSYAVLGGLPKWELPLWVQVIEYLPVYALIGWQIWRTSVGSSRLV